MSYTPILSTRALTDIDRLIDFVKPNNPTAADRLRDRLFEAVASLAEHPNRGRSVGKSVYRDLPVQFGRYGYLVRYRVSGDEVLITRIRHSREHR